MTKFDGLTTAFRRVIKALIVGTSCFFIGILLAVLSPLIAILSFFHKPKKENSKWAETLEQKIKEIHDPDLGEEWKKRHLELYGDQPEDAL